MAFNVPNAVNYRSPLNAVPLDWTSSPVEGAKGIQCTINWGTDGGPNKAVYLNAQNNATLNFSKVRAIVVDNSRSGADVVFVFPDTETTVTVPSYTPYAIIPVFTNQTQFYVVAGLAEPEDTTSFIILNTAPPPLAVPTTQEQNFASEGAITIAEGTHSVQLVTPDGNGTLEGFSINGYGYANDTANAFVVCSLTDGLGRTFWQGALMIPSNQQDNNRINFYLGDMTDVKLRFQGGLNFTYTRTGVAGATIVVACSIYYRQP